MRRKEGSQGQNKQWKSSDRCLKTVSSMILALWGMYSRGATTIKMLTAISVRGWTAVANTAWRCKFPLVRVINGDPRHSDHRPIIVDVGDRELRRWGKPREVLRKFEAWWLEEEECATKVEETWSAALMEGEARMMELQGWVLRELWEWDRTVLGVLEKMVKNARRELERCR